MHPPQAATSEQWLAYTSFQDSSGAAFRDELSLKASFWI
jgi:hypothetical protein